MNLDDDFEAARLRVHERIEVVYGDLRSDHEWDMSMAEAAIIGMAWGIECDLDPVYRSYRVATGLEIDQDDPYDPYDPGCSRCNGSGFLLVCPDDICQGQGECMHGDGEVICPDCCGQG